MPRIIFGRNVACAQVEHFTVYTFQQGWRSSLAPHRHKGNPVAMLSAEGGRFATLRLYNLKADRPKKHTAARLKRRLHLKRAHAGLL